ncbi:MAG: hypothetical protein WCE80_06175 [Acidimicrobiia bacterium]
MIPAFLEGLAQSVLPCSWLILLSALLVGMTTGRPTRIAAYAVSMVGFIWLAVSGWLSPPVWLAGLFLLVAALAWWRWGAGVAQTALVGVGVAWAWQPCVGKELGRALNLAQHDPVGALPGLAAFLIGVMSVGLIVGAAVRLVLSRRGPEVPRWLAPIALGALGLLMVTGLYGSVASTLARWSTSIWG